MKDLFGKVYKLLKKVPKGKVTTYKIIGQKLGTKGYRAVGNILNKNPDAPRVPCHRVVKSDGTVGGYAKGVDIKKRLLRKEGIIIKNNKIINFDNILENFKGKNDRK